MAAGPGEKQPERNRRCFGRVSTSIRLHRLCLHVGTDGQGSLRQRSAGRFLREQARYGAVLFRSSAATYSLVERVGKGRKRIVVPVGRRTVLTSVTSCKHSLT